jgi:hypothetical protein
LSRDLEPAGCRLLRGATSATQNRKSYCALFELLYPQYFPVFVRAAETWYDCPEVTTALLKFLQVGRDGQRTALT